MKVRSKVIQQTSNPTYSIIVQEPLEAGALYVARIVASVCSSGNGNAQFRIRPPELAIIEYDPAAENMNIQGHAKVTINSLVRQNRVIEGEAMSLAASGAVANGGIEIEAIFKTAQAGNLLFEYFTQALVTQLEAFCVMTLEKVS